MFGCQAKLDASAAALYGGSSYDTGSRVSFSLGENNPNPSKVLHVRNVPPDATERDIAQLGIPFGKMTSLVLAKRKNQVTLTYIILLYYIK